MMSSEELMTKDEIHDFGVEVVFQSNPERGIRG